MNLSLFSIAIPRGVRIRDLSMTQSEFLKLAYASNPAAEEAARVKRAQEHERRLKAICAEQWSEQ